VEGKGFSALAASFNNPTYIDDEECDMIESLNQAIDTGTFKIAPQQHREEKQAFWQQVVKNTEKRKAITLRLQNRDITRLKVIARRKGLPYQTFIASALHQLANGDLIER